MTAFDLAIGLMYLRVNAHIGCRNDTIATTKDVIETATVHNGVRAYGMSGIAASKDLLDSVFAAVDIDMGHFLRVLVIVFRSIIGFVAATKHLVDGIRTIRACVVIRVQDIVIRLIDVDIHIRLGRAIGVVAAKDRSALIDAIDKPAIEGGLAEIGACVFATHDDMYHAIDPSFTVIVDIAQAAAIHVAVDGTVEDSYRSCIEFARVDRAKGRATIKVAIEFRIFAGHVS